MHIRLDFDATLAKPILLRRAVAVSMRQASTHSLCALRPTANSRESRPTRELAFFRPA
jgi:hypothetical protein